MEHDGVIQDVHVRQYTIRNEEEEKVKASLKVQSIIFWKVDL